MITRMHFKYLWSPLLIHSILVWMEIIFIVFENINYVPTWLYFEYIFHRLYLIIYWYWWYLKEEFCCIFCLFWEFQNHCPWHRKLLKWVAGHRSKYQYLYNIILYFSSFMICSRCFLKSQLVKTGNIWIYSSLYPWSFK